MKTEKDYDRTQKPLFPTMVKNESPDGEYEFFPINGLTLLDYFAGQTLTGALASSGLPKRINQEQARFFAMNVYEMANAMLIAREEYAKAIWDEVPGLGKRYDKENPNGNDDN